MSKIRIQKALAELGIASRRAVEEMVLEGRIDVNGKTVKELPFFVDPGEDAMEVDGRPVFKIGADKKVYFLVSKPTGVVCTQNDPQGRVRLIDLLPKQPQRLYSVGRLDMDSTGLVVLTNDGEFTERLTHPRYGVVKTYVVQVEGRIATEDVERLKVPIYMDGKRTQGAWVKVIRKGRDRSLLEIKLAEGRNREIRRILARLGHKVTSLRRTAIGPITDRGLKIGSVRRLTATEVKRLLRCTEPEGREKLPNATKKMKTGKLPPRPKPASDSDESADIPRRLVRSAAAGRPGAKTVRKSAGRPKSAESATSDSEVKVYRPGKKVTPGRAGAKSVKKSAGKPKSAKKAAGKSGKPKRSKSPGGSNTTPRVRKASTKDKGKPKRGTARPSKATGPKSKRSAKSPKPKRR